MRIGIDFHAAQREGTGNCTYIRCLVEALLQIDQDNEYYLYITDSTFAYYQRFRGKKNVVLRTLPADHPALRIGFLGLRIFLDRIDLLHVQYVAPPFFGGKLIVTLHDISYLRYPQCFRKPELLYLRWLVPSALKRASRIVTISEFSRQEIINNYRVSPERVDLTHLGAQPLLRPSPDAQAKDLLSKRYGISGPYMLFVGRLDARKNLSSLIQAFDILKQKKKIAHQLVIVGKKVFLPSSFGEVLTRLSSKEQVILTGCVPSSFLPALYSLADVFIYPSLYEGFGLPCLEAMACGCPVIASNVSSFPEILGQAAILVNPYDVAEISEAMFKVISDIKLREQMKIKGLEKARQFNWEDTARKTLKIYKEILSC